MSVNDSNIPQAIYTQKVLGFMAEVIQEGTAFLQGQSGYNDFDDTINAINGDFTGDGQPPSVKRLSLNHFGKIALDMTAELTDIKPFWDYRTMNPLFQQQAQIANKRSTAWYINRNISLRLADVIKYCLAMGTGYPHLVYDAELDDQTIIPEDPRDVLPIRPGSLISIQEAMGVLIRRERTTNWVKAKYGVEVKPDRDASLASIQNQNRVSNMMNQMGLKSGFMTNLLQSLGAKPKAADLRVPTVDVFTCYLKDDAINLSDKPQWMGLTKKGEKTNWSYDVKPGENLYPRKRCIIFTRSRVLYDDTSIYWHGMFPTPKLTLDPWPWLWLGKAPLRDLLPLHAEVNEMMRTIAQHFRRVRRPGLAADKNSISQAALGRIDTEKAGLKLRHNPLAGKGIEMLYEPPLDQQAIPWLMLLLSQMDDLAGSGEAKQLAQLAQMPAADTVEQILASKARSMRLRSQVIESFMVEFAKMTLMNFFQFDTLAQRIAVLGPTAGVTFEDFDYDPHTLIPDMVDTMGRGTDGNPLPRAERAKKFIDQFKFYIAPGSLLASSGQQEKLLYLMLAKMGYVDIFTTLEKLNVPIGQEPPPGGIIDRLQWQAQSGIGMTDNAQGRKSTNEAAPRVTMKTS